MSALSEALQSVDPDAEYNDDSGYIWIPDDADSCHGGTASVDSLLAFCLTTKQDPNAKAQFLAEEDNFTEEILTGAINVLGWLLYARRQIKEESSDLRELETLISKLRFKFE